MICPFEWETIKFTYLQIKTHARKSLSKFPLQTLTVYVAG